MSGITDGTFRADRRPVHVSAAIHVLGAGLWHDPLLRRHGIVGTLAKLTTDFHLWLARGDFAAQKQAIGQAFSNPTCRL